MSYILDALKKSEKDRQRKSLPDILTVQDFAPKRSARPRYWVYLLAVFMVLNAGIFAWWLAGSSTGRERASQTSDAGVLSPLPADVITQRAPVRFKPSPYSAQAEKPQLRQTEEYIDSAAEKKVMPVRAERQLDQRVKAQAGENVRGKIAFDHSETVGESKQIPGPATEIVTKAGEFVSPPPEQASFHSDVPEPNRIYSLKDLPPGILKGLPPFSVSAFLYAEHPVSRMVRVNGQMMHEGEDLGAGVRLEEITKDGLIFSYRKFRFYVAAK